MSSLQKALLIGLVSLIGCNPVIEVDLDGQVCDFPEGAACPDCYGVATCSYDGVSVTVDSCGDCQASYALDDALCAAGSDATRQEVRDGMVCETDHDTGEP